MAAEEAVADSESMDEALRYLMPSIFTASNSLVKLGQLYTLNEGYWKLYGADQAQNRKSEAFYGFHKSTFEGDESIANDTSRGTSDSKCWIWRNWEIWTQKVELDEISSVHEPFRHLSVLFFDNGACKSRKGVERQRAVSKNIIALVHMKCCVISLTVTPPVSIAGLK